MATFSQYRNITNVCLYTLLLILTHASVTVANYERTCNYQSRPHPNGLCGSALPDVIRNLCTSTSSRMLNRYMSKRDADTLLDENLRNIMLNKKDAFSYLAKRESSANVICECCYNHCTIAELYQYCDISSLSSRRTRNAGRPLID